MIVVRIIWSPESLFCFSSKKKKTKRKQKYEKEEQDIHVIWIITTSGSQQVTFLVFPDFIRQPAATVRT